MREPVGSSQHHLDAQSENINGEHFHNDASNEYLIPDNNQSCESVGEEGIPALEMEQF